MLGASELRASLELRAKSVLCNQEEVTPEALESATLETLEAIKGREVALWAIYDFAMFRLRSFLHLSSSSEELESFELAKKEIKQSVKISRQSNIAYETP